MKPVRHERRCGGPVRQLVAPAPKNMARGHGLARRRVWTAALLLLALMVRAVVPAGWMPTVGPAGVQMVICTAEGLVEAPADWAVPGDEQSPILPGDHAPCVFAALGTPFLPHAIVMSVGPALAVIANAPPTGPPTRPVPLGRYILPPAQAPPFRN